MSFPDRFADLVISSAVLHFARDDDHFQAMLQGTWRVLKPGGLLFCRLASSIGMENQIQPIAGRRFRYPTDPSGTSSMRDFCSSSPNNWVAGWAIP